MIEKELLIEEIQEKILELQEFYNTNGYTEIAPNLVFTCQFCGITVPTEEMALEHSNNCIFNPLKFHGSTTDKNTKILLKAPNEHSNNYTHYQLLQKLGRNNTLVVDTDDGYRELTEEEILEENKLGYEPLLFLENQETIRSDKWQRQLDLVEQSVEEQREINESIKEFWESIRLEVSELKDKGLNEQDIAKELSKKYNLKE